VSNLSGIELTDAEEVAAIESSIHKSIKKAAIGRFVTPSLTVARRLPRLLPHQTPEASP
jgi:hypothetical protein